MDEVLHYLSLQMNFYKQQAAGPEFIFSFQLTTKEDTKNGSALQKIATFGTTNLSILHSTHGGRMARHGAAALKWEPSDPERHGETRHLTSIQYTIHRQCPA